MSILNFSMLQSILCLYGFAGYIVPDKFVVFEVLFSHSTLLYESTCGFQYNSVFIC